MGESSGGNPPLAEGLVRLRRKEKPPRAGGREHGIPLFEKVS